MKNATSKSPWLQGALHSSELSRLLGIPISKLEQIAERRLLPGIRIGSTWCFLPEEIEAWLLGVSPQKETRDLKRTLGDLTRTGPRHVMKTKKRS